MRIVTMGASTPDTLDVVVIGAGPAGVIAALRAGRVGAQTALITREEFGGLDYQSLLARVREVSEEVRTHSLCVGGIPRRLATRRHRATGIEKRER